MSLRLRFASSCLLALCLGLTSCGSEGSGSKPADAGALDASNQPIVGGKLGAAIASAAAASSASAKAKSSQGGDQPPENGIFAPGEADQRQPKSAPPKVDVLGEGTDPKVAMVGKLDAPEQKVTVTIGMRLGQNVRLPTVEYALSIKPEKAAGDKPKEGAPVKIAATITGVSLPGQQAGQPGVKELADRIGKLKGGVVRWDLAPGGGVSNFAPDLPKGAGEGLELVVDALVETLSLLSPPVPAKPVGKDGYWIAADRGRAAVGLDVVRFRVFKVQSLDDGATSLSFELRQYAADQKLGIPDEQGKKTEMPMDGFESQGKGTLVWQPNAFIAVRGELNERVGAKLGGGPRAGGVATELVAQVGGGGAAPATPAPGKKP